MPQLQTLEVLLWGGPNDFPVQGGALLVGEEIEADALDAPSRYLLPCR
jgi:hypothetical protein